MIAVPHMKTDRVSDDAPMVMPGSRRKLFEGMAWHHYGVALLTFSAAALVFFGLTSAFVAASEEADRHPAVYASDAAKQKAALRPAIDDPR